MSTSLLYHAFGVRGYQHVRTLFGQGQVEFAIRQESDTLRCSACGSDRLIRRGERLRRFKALPIGARSVLISLSIQRVACRDCGVVRQVRVKFADTQKTYTKPFERYAAMLCQAMTLEDVDSSHNIRLAWIEFQPPHRINEFREIVLCLLPVLDLFPVITQANLFTINQMLPELASQLIAFIRPTRHTFEQSIPNHCFSDRPRCAYKNVGNLIDLAHS